MDGTCARGCAHMADRVASDDSTGAPSLSNSSVHDVKTKVMGVFYSLKHHVSGALSSFSDSPIYCLGEKYDLNDMASIDPCLPKKAHRKPHVHEFIRDFESRLFFSYRRDFPRLEGSSYTSDSGWGCTLRSAQMMVAQAMSVCRLGRDFRIGSGETSLSEKSDMYPIYIQILKEFQDTPETPYSVHSMTRLGARIFDKAIGDWFGPATVARVLTELINRQRCENAPGTPFNAYLARDQVIYRDQVLRLFPSGSVGPLLTFVPVRLGISSVNKIYIPLLKKFLEQSSCVGIIGGKPKHSLYFVAYQSDGVIYFDPHALKKFVPVSDSKFNSDIHHTNMPVKMAFSSMDPTMSVGFLTQTHAEFDALCLFLNQLQQSGPSLISVQARMPVYMASPSTSHHALPPTTAATTITTNTTTTTTANTTASPSPASTAPNSSSQSIDCNHHLFNEHPHSSTSDLFITAPNLPADYVVVKRASEVPYDAPSGSLPT